MSVLHFKPQEWSPAEREAMLLRTKTMDEIRDAAAWLGVPFNVAYRERADIWRRRYYFLR